MNGEDRELSKLEKKIRGKKVIVLVHGLMADETIWKEIGGALEKGYPVLYVRYNSGLHISENGERLAKLLHDLLEVHRFKDLVLMGHSMGGLVARSACYYGDKASYPWVKQLRQVYLIAVPNAGAALEKLNHATSLALRAINRFYLGHIGHLMESRSNGIKDLRHGYMLEDDWKLGIQVKGQARVPVPPILGVRYHLLLGSLSKDENSMLAKYFGDGLVSPTSAVAQTLLKVSEIKTFPKTGHNSILKHPGVIQYIKKKV